MSGRAGMTFVVAPPVPACAAGAAGFPAAGGAGDGVPAVAAPGGFAGDGAVCAPVADVAGTLVGLDGGPELQAARRAVKTSRFIPSPPRGLVSYQNNVGCAGRAGNARD